MLMKFCRHRGADRGTGAARRPAGWSFQGRAGHRLFAAAFRAALGLSVLDLPAFGERAGDATAGALDQSIVQYD